MGMAMAKVASPVLEAFIDETIKIARENHYYPTIFIGMRQRLGTIPAISQLVQNGEIQSGFRRLKQLGLLDWTIESAVVKFPDEFSKTDHECAEFRLRMAREGEKIA